MPPAIYPVPLSAIHSINLLIETYNKHG